MKKGNITLAVHVIFGLIILAAGINKLYLFMPVPEQMPQGKEFIEFLYATGYLMYVVALAEIIGGGIAGAEPNGTTAAPDPGTCHGKYSPLSHFP